MTDVSLDFTIDRLGECRIPSPMPGIGFVTDEEHILYHNRLSDIQRCLEAGVTPPFLEVAGPREQIFFDPSRLKAGIVTCGGLCPGLNNVIRAIVLSLYYHYGVKTVYGFRYGYEGLSRRFEHPPLELTPATVNDIHELGGTILGSSRGPQDPADMVDTLERMQVGLLFTIGGDGTLRGAQAIHQEAARRGLHLAVIGIPKTIDNDLSFIQTTFGFETAVAEAKRSTNGAHSEAVGARNGIGLVKLMGRDSGFIAGYSVAGGQPGQLLPGPGSPLQPGRVAGGPEGADQDAGPCRHRGGRGGRPGTFGRDRGTGRLGESEIRGYRTLPEGPHQGVFQEEPGGSQHQVHRSQLHHPQPAGQSPGLGLLPAPGSQCRSCRPGREDQHGRRCLEQYLRPCTHFPGGLFPEKDRSPRLALEERDCFHGTAPGPVFRSGARIPVLGGLWNEPGRLSGRQRTAKRPDPRLFSGPLQPGPVEKERLFASLSLYLLFGLIFALIFAVIEEWLYLGYRRWHGGIEVLPFLDPLFVNPGTFGPVPFPSFLYSRRPPGTGE